MFFSAFLGKNKNSSLWENTIRRHSKWLDMNSYTESQEIEGGRFFCYGWVTSVTNKKRHVILKNKRHIIMTTSGEMPNGFKISQLKDFWKQRVFNIQKNVITIGLDKKSGELKMIIPLTTPEQFYFVNDSRGYFLSNDLRMMLGWNDFEIDECAVYSLFQYGAIPSPFTISKNVQQVPKGCVMNILKHSNDPVFEPFFRILGKEEGRERPLDYGESIKETLDNILKEVPSSSLLYFSGGVDSTLLASRLLKLKRKDIELINYSFGPQDKEAKLAKEMARYMGLNCKQIEYRSSDIINFLSRLGKDYSYPFGDYSVIPTNLMVHESLRGGNKVKSVINGIAADGAFGLGIKYPKWKRVYSVPKCVRRTISEVYKGLKLWQNNSKFEYVSRIFRRSIQMPMPYAAIIAQNCLDGIAYSIPPKVREKIEGTIKSKILNLSSDLNPMDQFSLLDLTHVCAGEFAPKSFDVLRKFGVKSIYPFLESSMVKLSFSIPWEEKCKGNEEKAILKNLLLPYIPNYWIFRPKNAFIPPIREILTYSSMQNFIRDEVMKERNPLTQYCHMDTVKMMVERAQKGYPLSNGTYNFLWVLIFTSGWLNQMEFL